MGVLVWLAKFKFSCRIYVWLVKVEFDLGVVCF